jgi:hypothetical protein
MLGPNKSRGYCLEICADSLAGATLDGGDPELPLKSQRRFFSLFGHEQQERFGAEVARPITALYLRPDRSTDQDRSPAVFRTASGHSAA